MRLPAAFASIATCRQRQSRGASWRSTRPRPGRDRKAAGHRRAPDPGFAEVRAAIDGKALAVCFFAVLGNVRVRLGKGLRVAEARDLNW